MKRLAILGIGFIGAMLPQAVVAQTHKVAKPETVVRAVGVYEWTGELVKPVASRLIPVSVFIDGKLEDAGVYLARPVPFALESGILYELDQAGVAKGTLDLAFARHLQMAESSPVQYDDGWFGYGSYVPPAIPKKVETTAKRQSTAVVTTTSANADRPSFSKKNGGGSSTPSAKTDDADKADSTVPGGDDPDRPHLSKKGGEDSKQGARTDSMAKVDDASEKADPAKGPGSNNGKPDDSAKTGAATASTGSGPAASDDPDRPTLKRRSPEEAKKAKRDDVATVSGVGSLNDDPDRPKMKRGKPASAMTEDDLPKLKGLPQDVHQMVAVSDAATRAAHDFSRAWQDDAERTAVMAKMRAFAVADVAAYGGPVAPVAVAGPSARTPVRKPGTAAKRAVMAPQASPGVSLTGEDLRGYVLSYGGQPTYVYQARTSGDGAALRYVTVVAQADGAALKVAMHSVTDALHLDRTPWMRLVDVVDAEASNRASLLFELRGQSSRSFGLYRVIGARSEAVFSTGTTQ